LAPINGSPVDWSVTFPEMIPLCGKINEEIRIISRTVFLSDMVNLPMFFKYKVFYVFSKSKN
jgi:hypothetical protein